LVLPLLHLANSMRIRILGICALASLAAGLAGHLRSASAPPPLRPHLNLLHTKAFALFQSGRYLESEKAFALALSEALRLKDKVATVRSLNALGGVHFALFQYREAMQSYFEARRLARELGDWEMSAAISSNLSSLYLQQQELNAGAQAAEDSLEALRRAGRTRLGPLLRAQIAIFHMRQSQFDSGLALFRQALDEAETQGDPVISSMIWDQLGYEYLQRGRLEDAEHALLQAFRLRKLNRLAELQYSYYTLGMLRLAQGNARDAGRLLDEAVARAASVPGTLPLWRVHYERGRARMADNKPVEALLDFEKSLDSARRLRLEVLPADSVWINANVDLSRLRSALIRAASLVYSRSGDPHYARLAFEAAEENRAASLRALIYAPAEWRRRLPPPYWEALAQLRGAEAGLLRQNTPALRENMSRLRYKLTEMEAQAGLDLVPSASGFALTRSNGLLARVQGSLQPGEALFSFHLDEPVSLLWAVTRSRFRMLPLPAKSEIHSLVERFGRAVAQQRLESESLGRELYSTLFASAPADILRQSRWVLVLDGNLFRVPVAALVSGRQGGRPEYLVERHTTQLLPAAALLRHGAGARRDRLFVGVGDPIYNAADPRRSAHSPGGLAPLRGYLGGLSKLFSGTPADASLEMARLAGSGREIEACRQAWGAPRSESILLSGGQASPEQLNQALAFRPSVVHFATHFLKSAGDEPQALMALSLGAGGSPELLGPVEIARRRVEVGLVVLSGCSSSEAAALPAEGLMGMTRAWLAAGAHAVIASLWPTPDDQGRLFVSFYRHLGRLVEQGYSGAAPEALRRAQLEMLNSGAWQASTAYWAAYTVAGKE
jgi:CHAT domain-containing protein/tetratricopeptide (TPR) repeat protein